MVIPKPGLIGPKRIERKPFNAEDFIDLESTPLETADKSLVVKINRTASNKLVAVLRRGKGYSSFIYNEQGRYLGTEPHPLDLYFKRKTGASLKG